MRKALDIKAIILLLIIAVGVYALTRSLAIAIGVGILVFIVDNAVMAWLDKKADTYFQAKQKDKYQDGETH